MKQDNLRYDKFKPEYRSDMLWVMINDCKRNPNFISKALNIDIKYIRDNSEYNVYQITSDYFGSNSKINNMILRKMILYSRIFLDGPKFAIRFIVNKKYSIEEVNKMLEDKISKHGIDYFMSEIVIHKYFMDANRQYYKLFDNYIDIETGRIFILYKGLFGNYEYYVDNYDYFLCAFIDNCPFSAHATYTNSYPNNDDIEFAIRHGRCSKVKEVPNHKNELYKAYKAIKKAKYNLFGANAYNNFTDYIIRNEIRHYNFLLKVIKCNINKIKEGESK